MAILLCALGPDEINEIRVGPLTPYAVRTLRCLKEMLGVTFSIKPEADSQTIFLACIGAAVKNNAKNVT
jgi:RNA 3'-terminal phosphate cyclase-like protein